MESQEKAWFTLTTIVIVVKVPKNVLDFRREGDMSSTRESSTRFSASGFFHESTPYGLWNLFNSVSISLRISNLQLFCEAMVPRRTEKKI